MERGMMEVSENLASATSLFDSLRRRLTEFGKAIERFEDLAEKKLEQKTVIQAKSQSLAALSDKLQAQRPPGYQPPRAVAWEKTESALEKPETV
jgi:hypothetical protein